MDYEKAYKESFGVAQCLHEAGDTTTKKQMERLFPQLAESDDYRDWKKVKRAIRIFFTNPTESNELLAWLEKKKEQKQVECIDFDNEFENQVSHLLASILNGEHEYNESFVKYAAQSLLGYAKNEMKPDEWVKREKLFTKALQTANTQIGKLFEENKKLKEQKSADDKVFEEWIDDWWKHNKVNNPDSYDNGDEIQFDEWNFKTFCRRIRNMYKQKPAEWSEDERIRKGLIEALKVSKTVGELKFVIPYLTREECIAYLEKQKEQKEQKPESCDCSRDEESYTNGIHHVLMNPEAYGLIKQKPAEQLGGTFTSYDMAKTFTEGQNYVIAHPEKFGLCKPAEWKEEDEGMLNCIIATLCEESHGGRETNDKMVTWLENRLKSLHPQSHWKPSEGPV